MEADAEERYEEPTEMEVRSRGERLTKREEKEGLNQKEGDRIGEQ